MVNLVYVLNVNSGGQEFQEARRAGGQGFRRSGVQEAKNRPGGNSRELVRCWPGGHQVRGTGQELGRPRIQDGGEFSRSRTGQEALRWDSGV